MKPVVYGARVGEDLAEIAAYIARDNPRAAEALVTLIQTRCASLARMPRMGRARPEIARGIRSLGAGSYVILYRVRRATVEIVRIVHGRRNLPDAGV